MNSIKTYVSLNIEIIKNKEAVNGRIWYLLRALDTNGKGFVHYDAFLNGIKLIGLSYEQWRKIENKNNLFFQHIPDQKVILYTSRDRLLNIFGYTKSKVALIPVEFFTNIKTFKAYLYESFFSTNNGMNISRQRIGEIFGLNKQSQLDYEKINGMSKLFQFAHAPLPKDASNEDKQMLIEDLPVNKSVWVDEYNVHWQTVNRYFDSLFTSKPVKSKMKSRSVEYKDDAKRIYFHKVIDGAKFIKSPCLIKTKSGNYVYSKYTPVAKSYNGRTERVKYLGDGKFEILPTPKPIINYDANGNIKMTLPPGLSLVLAETC